MKYYNNTLRQLKNTIFNATKKKIVVGAGDVNYGKDWIATNLEDLDMTNEEDWQFFFGDTKADCIFSEHTFEHLTPEQTLYALRNIYNFLKPGGRFRIAVPDGLFPDADYINYVKPGGNGPGADDHKVLYTYKTLLDALHQVPFMVDLVEHWDESGNFIEKKWDVEFGKVERSKKFDDRNINGVIKYSSIIADARK